MKSYLRRTYNLMVMIGIDPLKAIRLVKGIPFYLKGLRTLKRQKTASNINFQLGKLYPILVERCSDSGTAKGEYFHQDLLVARRIFLNKPKLHVDIGSRIDGFVTHVASFREIQVFDIRPLTTHVHNITFVQSDLMEDIDESLVGYCDSISCLHALEHFGLGRYGDPIKYDGYLDGLNNIYKILKKGGKFYFSVPIGQQRIEFNAQRVFSMPYLLEIFDKHYKVDVFSYVDDEGDLHEGVELTNSDEVANNFGCHSGCGIFELTKL